MNVTRWTIEQTIFSCKSCPNYIRSPYSEPCRSCIADNFEYDREERRWYPKLEFLSSFETNKMQNKESYF